MKAKNTLCCRLHWELTHEYATSVFMAISIHLPLILCKSRQDCLIGPLGLGMEQWLQWPLCTAVGGELYRGAAPQWWVWTWIKGKQGVHSEASCGLGWWKYRFTAKYACVCIKIFNYFWLYCCAQRHTDLKAGQGLPGSAGSLLCSWWSAASPAWSVQCHSGPAGLDLVAGPAQSAPADLLQLAWSQVSSGRKSHEKADCVTAQSHQAYQGVNAEQLTSGKALLNAWPHLNTNNTQPTESPGTTHTQSTDKIILQSKRGKPNGMFGSGCKVFASTPIPLSMLQMLQLFTAPSVTERHVW